MPIDVTAWQYILHASASRAEITESLMALAIRVPGLLETTEIQQVRSTEAFQFRKSGDRCVLSRDEVHTVAESAVSRDNS